MNWSYIAGFIDADGTIGLLKRKNKQTIEYHLRIVNKDRYTLEKILEFYKENGIHAVISRQSKKPICDGWSIIYVLQLGNRNGIKKILENTLPHLITKTKQAETMLHFFRIRKKKSWSHCQTEWDLYKQMCILNDGKGKSILDNIDERNDLNITK